jgi:hypothetical protein
VAGCGWGGVAADAAGRRLWRITGGLWKRRGNMTSFSSAPVVELNG